MKALVFGEAEVLLGRRGIGGAKRFAVHLVGAGLGTAIADDGAHRDQRRLVCLGFGGIDSGLDGVEIVAIGDALHVPMVRLEALQHILGEAPLGGTVE